MRDACPACTTSACATSAAGIPEVTSGEPSPVAFTALFCASASLVTYSDSAGTTSTCSAMAVTIAESSSGVGSVIVSTTVPGRWISPVSRTSRKAATVRQIPARNPVILIMVCALRSRLRGHCWWRSAGRACPAIGRCCCCQHACLCYLHRHRAGPAGAHLTVAPVSIR